MDKQEIIKISSKEEDKILIAKLLDKMQFAREKNQIQVTDFLDGYQQNVAQKVLQKARYKTYLFFGGYTEAERKMLFCFPEKLFDLVKEPMQKNGEMNEYWQNTQELLQKSSMIQSKIKVISIKLPNELKGEYHHRDYLSGLMKLGIKREKIGDILVREDGADIIVHEDILEYLMSSLPELTRFKKAEILAKSIQELEVVSIKMEMTTIIVTQLRLDTIISAILHISRTKANEIIEQERVLVNYETKTKNSVILQQGDLLTIRGKGKFKIGEIISQTVKGRLRVEVGKYSS